MYDILRFVFSTRSQNSIDWSFITENGRPFSARSTRTMTTPVFCSVGWEMLRTEKESESSAGSMFAFSQSVAYFYMPGDLARKPVGPGTLIRLGGLNLVGIVAEADAADS